MRKEIKYIGFYDLQDTDIKRVSSIAAVNKMDYISEAIIKSGYDVNIISPSWSSNNDRLAYYLNEKIIQINPHKKVTFCPTFSTRNKITRYLKIVFTLLWLFIWLIRNVERNEKIIVYHTQWLSFPLRLAKRLKGFHLVLEVEEIYEKIWEKKKIMNKWEQKLIKSADSYIAVSDLLAEMLGEKTKAVVYGNYSVPIYNDIKPYFENNKINVVYAGSIDHVRGGAYSSIKCAELLPEKYLLHISGPGSETSKKILEDEIEKLNTKIGRVACIYHGVIDEDIFPSFLLSCQISLNPQLSGVKFNYLFPSKIIKYLAFNLRIVSTKIDSIEKSDISSFVFFSVNDFPESIVDQILRINLDTSFNSQAFIKKLNDNFILDIKKLLTIN